MLRLCQVGMFFVTGVQWSGLRERGDVRRR